jgi:hypothetical protein
VEVLGAGRSAVIDDFRRVRLYPSRPGPGRVARRQDKGHGALMSQALAFLSAGGEPPIPYERMIETSRATLLAADAVRAGRPASVEL